MKNFKHVLSLMLALVLCVGWNVPAMAGGSEIALVNPQKMEFKITDKDGKDTGIIVTVDQVYEKYNIMALTTRLYVTDDATIMFNIDAICFSPEHPEEDEFVIKANKPVKISEYGTVSFGNLTRERYGFEFSRVFIPRSYYYEEDGMRPIDELLLNDGEATVPPPKKLDISTEFLTDVHVDFGLEDEGIHFSRVFEQYCYYTRNEGRTPVYVFYAEPGTSVTFDKFIFGLTIADENGYEEMNWLEESPPTKHTIVVNDFGDIYTFIEDKSIEIRSYFSLFFITNHVRGVGGELRPVSELLSGDTSAPTPTPPEVQPATSTEQPSSWAADQVAAAISADLVAPSLQSEYTQATTRAEFCSLAVALYESIKGEITGRTTFDDTQDINVEKAAAIEIVSGVGNNKFDPDAQLTREQAAVMLSRLADAVGKPISKQAATFADIGGISSWATDGVGQMQSSSIMSGVGDNMFAPQDSYTREQSIVTILRLYNLVK